MLNAFLNLPTKSTSFGADGIVIVAERTSKTRSDDTGATKTTKQVHAISETLSFAQHSRLAWCRAQGD